MKLEKGKCKRTKRDELKKEGERECKTKLPAILN